MVVMTIRPAARAALAALLAALSITTTAQQTDVASADGKLTTVLADLVTSAGAATTP